MRLGSGGQLLEVGGWLSSGLERISDVMTSKAYSTSCDIRAEVSRKIMMLKQITQTWQCSSNSNIQSESFRKDDLTKDILQFNILNM